MYNTRTPRNAVSPFARNIQPSRKRRFFAALVVSVGLLTPLAAAGEDSSAGRGSSDGAGVVTGESDQGDEATQQSTQESQNNTGRQCPTPPDFKFAVNEAKLPFDALPGTETARKYGVLNGAGWRAEIPKNWNGELVMWAHGFAGWECELNVDPPPMRAYLVSKGYAWAASSYSRNGYVVQQGVDDTMRLARHFNRRIAKVTKTYLAGASMGGHITGVAIEQNQDYFAGAMPVCGVMGSGKLFDYFTDFNELAQSISGVQTPYPYGVDYVPGVVPKIKAALGDPTSPKYQALAAATQQRSGGIRPGFAVGFGVWLDFLFGLGQPTPGVVPAFPSTNKRTVYQYDNDPAVSPAEAALNASIRRVKRFDYPTPDGTVTIPRINGDINIPTLTLHTLGDLFVPFSMEQAYARRVAANDNSDLLVQRAIRDVGHCSFSQQELNEGFADLAAWVKSGTAPAGDDVLSPATVASPQYGCRFSRTSGGVGETPARGAFGPCPTT